MKLCWSCFAKLGGDRQVWNIIPNKEVKEKCGQCGLEGIYVRETKGYIKLVAVVNQKGATT